MKGSFRRVLHLGWHILVAVKNMAQNVILYLAKLQSHWVEIIANKIWTLSLWCWMLFCLFIFPFEKIALYDYSHQTWYLLYQPSSLYALESVSPGVLNLNQQNMDMLLFFEFVLFVLCSFGLKLLLLKTVRAQCKGKLFSQHWFWNWVIRK